VAKLLLSSDFVGSLKAIGFQVERVRFSEVLPLPRPTSEIVFEGNKSAT
jgi:hypothetical protein